MKILIELPTWIGDTVMATPAIENVVNTYPDSEIFFLGQIPSIDLLIFHPNHKNNFILEKNIFSFLRLSKDISKMDIFISLRSSFRSRILRFFINSNMSFQFNNKKYLVEGHQVEKYNKFIGDVLNNPLPPGNLILYKNKNLRKKLKKGLNLIISPGAAYGEAKCWPVDKYVEVINNLKDVCNIYIIGSKNEKSIANEILRLTKNTKVYDLTGQTKIPELVHLISLSNLFITGDSGPMHIAAAFNIPTIAIFGPTNHVETCQWRNQNSIIFKKSLDCQPCMKRVCPLSHHKCMRLIDSKEITNKAIEFLGEAIVN